VARGVDYESWASLSEGAAANADVVRETLKFNGGANVLHNCPSGHTARVDIGDVGCVRYTYTAGRPRFMTLLQSTRGAGGGRRTSWKATGCARRAPSRT